MKTLCLIFLTIVLISCGGNNEVGRFDLLKQNHAEFKITLDAEEEVLLFADIDITYKEKPPLVFNCDFYRNGEYLFGGGTDPLMTTENSNDTKTINDGITHWKFYGKLEGSLTATEKGNYRIITTLLKNKQVDLKINKAEIVFVKQ